MPFLAKMISFWNNLFRRQRVERDLNDELLAYVEEMAERKIQAGLAPDAAREAALVELGGIDRIKDLVRQQRVGFGNLRRAGLIVIVAIVAFVSGAGAAVTVVRWNTPLPVEGTLSVVIDRDTRATETLPVLQGRVVDRATGEPIPNVEIGLQAFAPFRRYTFTDDQGRFGFTNPPSQGYRLEAGDQRWAINGNGGVSPSHVFPLSDRFSIYTPTDLRIKDKDGQPLEGERTDLKGVVYNEKNAKFVDLMQRRRTFMYSSSTIELPATNLHPGIVKR